MNWYNFDKRFPRTFREFRDWYLHNYREEYLACEHPVYQAPRLLEFFKSRKLPVEVSPAEEYGGMVKVSIGDHEISNAFNHETALNLGVYHAFELLEEKYVNKQ